MSKNPLHLLVLNRGTIQFPRYLIGNDYRWFWAGSGWTGIEKKAVLFTDWNTEATEVQKLQLLPWLVQLLLLQQLEEVLPPTN